MGNKVRIHRLKQGSTLCSVCYSTFVFLVQRCVLVTTQDRGVQPKDSQESGDPWEILQHLNEMLFRIQ